MIKKKTPLMFKLTKRTVINASSNPKERLRVFSKTGDQ